MVDTIQTNHMNKEQRYDVYVPPTDNRRDSSNTRNNRLIFIYCFLKITKHISTTSQFSITLPTVHQTLLH